MGDADREPPQTASTPIVAPPPPPPSQATRRAIMPTPHDAPDPPPTPPSPPSPPAPAPRRPGPAVLVVGVLVVVALVALGIALLAGRDSGTPAASSSAVPEVVPTAVDPANVQPGRPPGVDDPPAPSSASPMVALRHTDHVGFERVAVDFAGTLPPRIQAVEFDAALRRVRVVFDQPRPAKATAPVQLDVVSGTVRSVVFVVDADRTYVDVFTNQAVDASAFRLANVAFNDGSARGVVVIDVVPSSNPPSSGGPTTTASG